MTHPTPRLDLRPLRRACLAAGVWMLATVGGLHAQAQGLPPVEPAVATDSAPSPWERQIGLGYGLYRESAMSLRGPELLLGLRWKPSPTQRYALEWSAAQQHYDSDDTGAKSDVPYYEGRLQGLYRLGDGPAWLRDPELGWLVHYGYNDLRGRTTTQHIGYERVSWQLWLPLRWRASAWFTEPSTALELEIGWLLYGQQTSRLSQVSAVYTDARNQQRHGVYLQVRGPRWGGSSAAQWEPSLRITRIEDSDKVRVSTSKYALEPANLFIHLGLARVW